MLEGCSDQLFERRDLSASIFGIEPTGFKQFNLAPYLPSEWDNMCLNNIRAFDTRFDVCVQRQSKNFEVTITDENGNKELLAWDGLAPLTHRF